MTALSVKATMALVAKHTLVVDKVTVEAWVQIPPLCAGEHTKERKLWQQQYLGRYTNQKERGGKDR